MISNTGGFNDQYEVPNNRIAYCRADLESTFGKVPQSNKFYLERQSKQAIVELTNTFIDEILDNTNELLSK